MGLNSELVSEIVIVILGIFLLVSCVMFSTSITKSTTFTNCLDEFKTMSYEDAKAKCERIVKK
jgi:hypothetical protein